MCGPPSAGNRPLPPASRRPHDLEVKMTHQACAVLLAAFGGYALFNDDPFGGEPLVRIAIAPPTGNDKAPAKSGEMSAEKPAEKSTLSTHAGEPSANSGAIFCCSTMDFSIGDCTAISIWF